MAHVEGAGWGGFLRARGLLNPALEVGEKQVITGFRA